MAKKIKALIVINRANKQINLTLPKKKLSTKMVADLMKAKSVDLNLDNFIE